MKTPKPIEFKNGELKNGTTKGEKARKRTEKQYPRGIFLQAQFKDVQLDF